MQKSADKSIFTTVRLLSVLIIAIVLLEACSGNENKQRRGKVLAKVYDTPLEETEVKNKIPAGLHGEDSMAFAKSYIEKWIRRQLLVVNARKSIKDFDKIEELVKDYETSLIIDSFTQQLVKEKLDTSVTEKQLKDFYNKNKSNFILDKDLVRLRYVKVNGKQPGLDKFYDNWNNGNWDKVEAYAKKNAKTFILDSRRWHRLDSVKQIIPGFLLKKKRKYAVQKYSKGYEYFLKVMETKYKNENIPLEVIKHKIKTLILQKRKSDLLDGYIKQLHKKEIENNKIIIY